LWQLRLIKTELIGEPRFHGWASHCFHLNKYVPTPIANETERKILVPVQYGLTGETLIKLNKGVAKAAESRNAYVCLSVNRSSKWTGYELDENVVAAPV
jgi:hypothetical protein